MTSFLVANNSDFDRRSEPPSSVHGSSGLLSRHPTSSARPGQRALPGSPQSGHVDDPDEPGSPLQKGSHEAEHPPASDWDPQDPDADFAGGAAAQEDAQEVGADYAIGSPDAIDAVAEAPPEDRGGAIVKADSPAMSEPQPGSPDNQDVIDVEVKEISDACPDQAPFDPLGWAVGKEGNTVMVRRNKEGSIFGWQISKSISKLMLLHEDKEWWAKRFPGQKPGTTDEDAAYAWILQQTWAKGIFDFKRVRGRGVYIDEDRVVIHLGSHLEVDGIRMPISGIQSKSIYSQRPELPIDLGVEELDDVKGAAILTFIRSIGWDLAEYALYVAGYIVASMLSGALPHRPGILFNSGYSTGKTFVNRNVIGALQAGIALAVVDPSVAGIRQLLNGDALPVWIDEFEAEKDKVFLQILEFIRYCFDGVTVPRGSKSGNAIEYRLASCVAISGINAPINDPANSSRIVTVSRRQISHDEWVMVEQTCDKLITPATGPALFRRSVNHLPTLLKNIKVFRSAIQALLPQGVAPRYTDTHSVLLAGAHLLVSTKLLDVPEAQRWLAEQGWEYRPGDNAWEYASNHEAYNCLIYLLSKKLQDEVVWGVVSRIRVSERPTATDAQSLAGHGLRVLPEHLAIANSGTGWHPFQGTRWSNGSHKNHLIKLPGAQRSSGTFDISGAGSYRAVLIPWKTVDAVMGATETSHE